MSNDYLANDWMINLDLLLYGKFKTIEDSYIVLGVKGFSKSKTFLKTKQYYKKNILFITPI